MQGERTLPELTKDLASQIGDLMRNEVRLARAEALDSIKGMGAGILRAAFGIALAAAAITLGLFAIAYALGEAMPMWAGALISAAIGGVLAYGLVKAGLKEISVDRINLPRTAEQVARDLRMLKEKI